MLGGISALGQAMIETIAGPEAIFSGVAKQVVTKALGDTAKKFGKSIIAQSLYSGVGEGLEEVGQYYTSQITKYMGQETGMIGKDVELPKATLKDLTEQFLGGAIPGVVLGGIGGGINKFRTNSKEQAIADTKAQEEIEARKGMFDETDAAEQPIVEQRKTVTEQINQALGDKGKVELNNIEIVTPKVEGELTNNPLITSVNEKLKEKGLTPGYFISYAKTGQDIAVISKDNNTFINIVELQRNPEKVLADIELIKPLEPQQIQNNIYTVEALEITEPTGAISGVNTEVVEQPTVAQVGSKKIIPSSPEKNNIETSTPSSIEQNPLSANKEVNATLEEQRKEIKLPKFNEAETDARLKEELKAKPEEFTNRLATTTPTAPESARAYQVFFNSKEAETMAKDNPSKFFDIGFNAFDLRHLSGQMLRAWHRLNKASTSSAQEAKSLLVSLIAKPSDMYEKEVKTIGKEKAVANEKARNEKIVEGIKKKYGINPMAANKFDLADYNKITNMVRTIKNAKKTTFSRNADIAMEYWMNSILSGIKTHMANIVGNTAYMAVEFGPQRLTESMVGGLINTISGGKFSKNTSSVKEWVGMMKNTIQSFKPALKGAKEAFKNEATQDTMSKLEFEAGVIPGKLGKIIRLPFRLLLAEDEMAKTIIRNVESQAMAYRTTFSQMREEGIKLNTPEGKAEFQKRMTEELNNPDSYSSVYAENRALELTFQEPLSGALAWMDKARQDKGITGLILRFMFPFVKTPWNITRTGVRKTPLGTLGMVMDLATGKYKAKPELIIPRISEQILAWTTTALLMSLIGDDDKEDEPWITGSAPKYGTGEYAFKMKNIPPTSIRIGDTWYNYGRLQPLGISLGFIADAIDIAKTSKEGEPFAKSFDKARTSITKNITDQTFLQGLNDIVKLMESDKPISGQIVSNFIASWIPNAYRQTLNSTREEFADRRNYEKDFGSYVKEELNQLIPTLFNVKDGEYIPKVDLWGNDIKNQPTAPVNSTLWKIVMPVSTTPAGMDKKDQMIWNYNKQNADKEYWPNMPDWWFKMKDETHYFTKQQFYEYSKLSGQYASTATEKLINEGKLNYKNPTSDDMYVVKKIFNIAREKAKIEVILKNK